MTEISRNYPRCNINRILIIFKTLNSPKVLFTSPVENIPRLSTFIITYNQQFVYPRTLTGIHYYLQITFLTLTRSRNNPNRLQTPRQNEYIIFSNITRVYYIKIGWYLKQFFFFFIKIRSVFLLLYFHYITHRAYNAIECYPSVPSLDFD